jgi:hypothetical protein
MSKAIVHKLNKETRRKIAFNYVEDFFKEDIDNLQKYINNIATESLERIKERFTEKDINNIENSLKKVGINGTYKKGLLHSHFRSGDVSLSLKIYCDNAVQLYLRDNDSSPFLDNQNVSDTRIDYTAFVNYKNSDVNRTLFEFENNVKDIRKSIWERFDLCYELLSKVRTAELLMKHWSDAHKYLPEDIEVEEPQKLSLSERFELL